MSGPWVRVLLPASEVDHFGWGLTSKSSGLGSSICCLIFLLLPGLFLKLCWGVDSWVLHAPLLSLELYPSRAAFTSFVHGVQRWDFCLARVGPMGWWAEGGGAGGLHAFTPVPWTLSKASRLLWQQGPTEVIVYVLWSAPPSQADTQRAAFSVWSEADAAEGRAVVESWA